MKIAVYHNLPPGGAKRVIFEEVKRLGKHNELYLFELSSTDEEFMNIKPFFVNVCNYKFDLKDERGIVHGLRRDFKNFLELKGLHKKIAEDIYDQKFDVCLIHPDRFTQAPFLLRFIKIPTVYFCEELLRIVYEKELAFNNSVVFYKRLYEKLTRSLRKNIDIDNAKYADKILTASEYIKNKAEKAYWSKVNVCNLGVDTNKFKPLKNKENKEMIFIGEKEKVTGHEFACEVLRLVVSQGLRLNVVSFLNKGLKLSDIELCYQYSKALAALCTSYNEPFGLVPLESMACETPVLAVNEGGYRETVIDGVTGYLLPRDPKAFAEKIIYLYNHPEIVRRMGKAGREHVKKNFTWEKHVKCIEKQLYEIAKQKPR